MIGVSLAKRAVDGFAGAAEGAPCRFSSLEEYALSGPTARLRNSDSGGAGQGGVGIVEINVVDGGGGIAGEQGRKEEGL